MRRQLPCKPWHDSKIYQFSMIAGSIKHLWEVEATSATCVDQLCAATALPAQPPQAPIPGCWGAYQQLSPLSPLSPKYQMNPHPFKQVDSHPTPKPCLELKPGLNRNTKRIPTPLNKSIPSTPLSQVQIWSREESGRLCEPRTGVK